MKYKKGMILMNTLNNRVVELIERVPNTKRSWFCEVIRPGTLLFQGVIICTITEDYKVLTKLDKILYKI